MSNMPRRSKWPTGMSILKNGCKEIAWCARQVHHLHGEMELWARRQFLAYPSEPVVDGRQDSLFHDPKADHGMSALMKHYLAGLLAHASEITYFLAPYINSYKRFMAGTFAPTRAIWSFDNRTAGYRLCGADSKAVRVECRVGGADLNPYLAFAALIAAGLDGIEKKMELEPAFSGDAYDTQEEAARNSQDPARGDRAAGQVQVPAHCLRR